MPNFGVTESQKRRETEVTPEIGVTPSHAYFGREVSPSECIEPYGK